MVIKCKKCSSQFDSNLLKKGRCVHCNGNKFIVVSGANVHRSRIGTVIDGDSFLDDVIDFAVAATVIDSIVDSFSSNDREDTDYGSNDSFESED